MLARSSIVLESRKIFYLQVHPVHVLFAPIPDSTDSTLVPLRPDGVRVGRRRNSGLGRCPTISCIDRSSDRYCFLDPPPLETPTEIGRVGVKRPSTVPPSAAFLTRRGYWSRVQPKMATSRAAACRPAPTSLPPAGCPKTSLGMEVVRWVYIGHTDGRHPLQVPIDVRVDGLVRVDPKSG